MVEKRGTPVRAIEDSASLPYSGDWPAASRAQRRLPAWSISLILHCLLMAILAAGYQWADSAGEASETRTGGIVLVDVSEQATTYLDEAESERSASSPASGKSSPDGLTSERMLPGAAEVPDSLAGRHLSAGGSTNSTLFDSMADLDEMAQLSGRGGVEAEVGTTSVFGLQGKGSRFVYVFDRSGSMAGYQARPLRAAKRELIRSLQSLDEVHQFQILFYNNRPQGFRPHAGQAAALVLATESQKRRAKRFVNSISASGGTDHMAALEVALAMRPDVIFLLTDAEGGFSASELGHLREQNIASTLINAIEFGVGPESGRSDRSLERLAELTGGQYLYRDLTKLPLQAAGN